MHLFCVRFQFNAFKHEYSSNLGIENLGFTLVSYFFFHIFRKEQRRTMVDFGNHGHFSQKLSHLISKNQIALRTVD